MKGNMMQSHKEALDGILEACLRIIKHEGCVDGNMCFWTTCSPSLLHRSHFHISLFNPLFCGCLYAFRCVDDDDVRVKKTQHVQRGLNDSTRQVFPAAYKYLENILLKVENVFCTICRV